MGKSGVRINSDLQSVGEILKTDLKYEVPLYQRNFSWTMDEVTQLWQDIREAIVEKRAEYFLGTVVVEENQNDKVRTVIDGQQRLATLTMILASIRAAYSDYGDDRSKVVYLAYLGNKGRRTRKEEARLTLNEANKVFFQNNIISNASIEQITKEIENKSCDASNKLLGEAFLYLRKEICKLCQEASNFEDPLLDIEEFIGDKIVIILVAVGDETDAYLIFETLNDRGLDLSTSDLLKNYIFGKAGPSNLDIVRRQWQEIVFNLGSNEHTQFLRHYYLSHYGGILREKDLFKALRRKFSDSSSILKLVQDLTTASDRYAATLNVDHNFWTGYSTSCRRNLETLHLLNLSQFRPLLLAAMDYLEQKEIEKIVHIILVISMRYSIIGSQQTGSLEKAYADAAVKVRNGVVNSPAKVFNELRSMYPKDSEFEELFSSKTINKAKLARYIIASIVNHASGKKSLEVNRDEAEMTLEHIMPKKRTADWATVTADEAAHRDNVWRIGNLTLLEKELNRHIGSASFDKKKVAFAKSNIEINNDLVQFESWTPDAIYSRQQALAKVATKVWNIDY